MQRNSINRYKIDWVTFRQSTIYYAGNAQTERDAYDAIKYALKNLNDNHSFFLSPEDNINILSKTIISDSKSHITTKNYIANPIGRKITTSIGVIRIPAFVGSGQAMIDFATFIQNIIRGVDSSSIRGWIVDLRQNNGGNMWPMTACVGPILGEG